MSPRAHFNEDTAVKVLAWAQGYLDVTRLNWKRAIQEIGATPEDYPRSLAQRLWICRPPFVSGASWRFMSRARRVRRDRTLLPGISRNNRRRIATLGWSCKHKLCPFCEARRLQKLIDDLRLISHARDGTPCTGWAVNVQMRSLAAEILQRGPVHYEDAIRRSVDSRLKNYYLRFKRAFYGIPMPAISLSRLDFALPSAWDRRGEIALPTFEHTMGIIQPFWSLPAAGYSAEKLAPFPRDSETATLPNWTLIPYDDGLERVLKLFRPIEYLQNPAVLKALLACSPRLTILQLMLKPACIWIPESEPKIPSPVN